MEFTQTAVMGTIRNTITNIKNTINNMFDYDDTGSQNETIKQQEYFEKFGNIMIDVETLSTKTNAAIIEIAAVEFNKLSGEIGDTFNVIIRPSEWGKNNRDVDGETVLWWMKQSEEAKKKYNNNEHNMFSLHNALCELSLFIKKHDNADKQIDKSVVVWGNGATMDITILQSAYEHFNMETPWKFWAVNDCRTIVDLLPYVKEQTSFDGIKHNPIDDCKYQIKYVTDTIKHLKII